VIMQVLLRAQSSTSSGPDSDQNGTQGDVPIPEHVERHGEPVEILRARLQYQSRKRGTLENGLLLRYADCPSCST